MGRIDPGKGSGLMISGYPWTRVEGVLGTFAGAWLYREGDEAGA
jgi:hypothetical protein